MVPMKEETGLDVAVCSTVAVNDGCERCNDWLHFCKTCCCMHCEEKKKV